MPALITDLTLVLFQTDMQVYYQNGSICILKFLPKSYRSTHICLDAVGWITSKVAVRSPTLCGRHLRKSVRSLVFYFRESPSQGKMGRVVALNKRE